MDPVGYLDLGGHQFQLRIVRCQDGTNSIQWRLIHPGWSRTSMIDEPLSVFLGRLESAITTLLAHLA